MNRGTKFAILLTSLITIFSVLLITALSVTSFAAPSNEIKAINQIPSSDHRISSLILVEGNPNTMSAHIKDGRIHIKDNLHTNRKVRLKYYNLYNILNNFNGRTLGYTHIAHDGTLTHKVVNVGSIDSHGFISLEMEFSEVIIDGFTGTTTIEVNGLSGNHSISVPNSSSYDLNITNNQAGTYLINGLEWNYKLPFYQNSSVAFNNTQHELNNTNFPITSTIFNHIETDGNNLPIINITYGNETNIPFYSVNWVNESNFSLYTKTNSGIENLSLLMFYNGNNGTDSGSNRSDVMIDNVLHDYMDGDILNDGTSDFFRGQQIVLTAEFIYDIEFGAYSSGAGVEQIYHIVPDNGGKPSLVASSIASKSLSGVPTGDYTISNVPITSTATYWLRSEIKSGDYVNTYTLKGYTTSPYPGGIRAYSSDDSSWTNQAQDFEFRATQIMKYSSVKPIYSYGVEQQAEGSTNITASVTGDSNTQQYNSSQTRAFTLTPTGITNNVNINTTSENYDIKIITYWTENTVKYSEIISNGYANTTIQYTPLFNITSGVLNSTYNAINFVDHNYNGELICLVDGVNYNGNASRSGNDVNVSIEFFDTSMHWINFSVAYNPALALYSPVDDSILNFTFPPLNHDVLLSWMNTTGTYKYEVYEGASIKRTGVINTNSTTVSLPAGDYTWLSYGFDDIFNEYSEASESFDFTISTNITYENTTGVHGVVYDYLIGIETPLENAGVYIWNDTFSSSTITSADGYFSFTELDNSTYYLIAKKDRYYDSNTEVVTLITKNMTEHNIRLIENTGTDYNKHYVKFILKSFFGTLYSNVLSNVYIGDSTSIYLSESTGTDGSVVFELTESQEYRITFINETQNIDETIITMPSDTLYEIIIFGSNIIPPDRTQDDILFSVQGDDVNTTHGIINVTFTDTSGTTELAQLLIKNNDANQTTLYHFNTTDSTKEWSQIVDGGNASYTIEFKIDNPILSETLTITRTIYFDSVVRVDLGLTNNWTYILIAVSLITVIALLSSMLNAEIMAVVTVLTGWTMIYFGWLIAGMSTEEEITMYLMMLFATLIAFGSVIKKGENR